MTAEFTSYQVGVMFFERERARCFRCGRPLRFEERGFGWSVHHRRPRGMGGSREEVTCAHGIILCGHATTPGGCHGWVEKHRRAARAAGLLISHLATTAEYKPDRVPAQDLAGRWWRLTNGGLAIEVKEEGESWTTSRSNETR